MKVYSDDYLLEDGKTEIAIKFMVDNGEVTDVIADENIDFNDYHFEKGDIINTEGDESMIRSEDITLSENSMVDSTIEYATEIDQFKNDLPELEIGDVVTLGEVWDGEGETPDGAYSYLISRPDNGVETWLDYQFDVLEEKEDELDTIVKITDICLM